MGKNAAEPDAARSMTAGFVHLRARSAYSLLEGAIPVKELPALCRAHGMPAIGVTDTNNLFGAIEISEGCAGAGIQPIIGASLALDLEIEDRQPGRPKKAPVYPLLPVLAATETGYGHLLALSSALFLDTPPTEKAHLSLAQCEGRTEGLIALTGGPAGPVNTLITHGKPEAARDLLERLNGLFPGNLYIELQRHGEGGPTPEEAKAEGYLLDWAEELGLAVVATNEPYFPERTFHEAHDALICIAEGVVLDAPKRRRLTPEHYFKSADEMAALFADLPEAVANTLAIARRCSFRPKKHAPILPPYETGSGRSEAEELRRQAEEGLAAKLEKFGRHRPDEAYRKRLEYELDVIIRMQYQGYFLIVSDFMKWARAEQIPVGVRGSGATSIVAWAMDITSLDPLRFDLVFERFLNPERVSMPDFDIDFCQERRGEVIRYVQDKYGHDTVAQIITFGTLQARAAVRDVGRVLGLPYGQVDKICKLIPAPPGKPVKLADAIKDDPRLQAMIDDEPEVRRLMDIARQLEGLYRHASTHAAGLVIADRPLTRLVPLYRDPRADLPLTQFHWKDVEKAGLVKFDFLGLKTLTVIAHTERLLKERGIEVRAQDVPFDDAKTFEMLGRGESVGVFQLESAGMRDLLRQMKPDRIEDLIALVALYRPGPMDSIPRYISCKHGREAPHYLHPLLEDILAETFGVMTYQEDVMRVARDLAGYSLGEADLLRRAMGKKIQAEMDKHRVKFVEGAAERDVPAQIAEEIFQQAAKFAGYGFNKGHAAAYAQVAYQTAYLKANYPVEFLCASMTLDMGNTERLSAFRWEAKRLGVPVLPPDVNASRCDFAVGTAEDGTPAILYALGAIKGMGEAAMESIVAGREAKGPYKELTDFAERSDPRMINRRTFEGLARAGAFDRLCTHRAEAFVAAEKLHAISQAAAEERASQQSALFGAEEVARARPPLPSAPPWPAMERLSHELDMLGFYLSGHPLDDAALGLRRKGVAPVASLLTGGRRPQMAKVAGLVLACQERRTQRTGAPFAMLDLSDPSGGYRAMAFSEVLNDSRALLSPGSRVLLTIDIRWPEDGDGEPRFLATKVEDLDAALRDAVATVTITVDGPEGIDAVKACLEADKEAVPASDRRRGGSCVHLRLWPPDGTREIEMTLPGRFAVRPASLEALEAARGVVDVEAV